MLIIKQTSMESFKERLKALNSKEINTSRDTYVSHIKNTTRIRYVQNQATYKNENKDYNKKKNTTNRFNSQSHTHKRVPYYNAKEQRNTILSSYQANDDICNLSKEQIERLKQCGTIYYNDCDTGKNVHYRCNLSICPICKRRNALNKKDTNEKIDNKCSKKKYVTQMHTIAINNDVDADKIRLQLDILITLCTKLFNQRQYKKYAIGSMRALEVSVSDTGLYHPHIHLLVMCDENSLDMLEELIKKIFVGLDVLASPPRRYVNTKLFTLYVYKLNDSKTLNAKEIHDINTAIKGKQLLTYTGLFRALKNVIIKKSSE